MKTLVSSLGRVGAIVALAGAFFLLPVSSWRIASARAAEPLAFRRYALVLSSNDGGTGRAVLRFADSDAVNVSRVLETLGGVERVDLREVKRASRQSVKAAFVDLKERLRPMSQGPRPRSELFVYYSGHSDEEGLLLGGGERVTYRELRSWIEDVGADVRIAILDSCASGALVRLRGGVHRPPFLSDVSAQTRGHAYLTASSADEAAQESDRIGSAFFTYYLLSGLRGAADANRDRRVTLNEAYHFAYSETLRRTEGSMAGAQHPAYDIQLAGTGDLVITDLRAPRARLVLPEKLAGRIYVRDDAGRLVAELRKEPLYPVELGLEPGNYRVVLDKDGRAGEASVALTEGGTVALLEERFTALPSLVATARGDGPQGQEPDAAVHATAPAPVPAPTTPGEPSMVDVPFEVGIVPGLRFPRGLHVRNHFVLGLLVAESNVLDGMQLSLVGNVTQERLRGLQLSNAFNVARGDSEGIQITAGANIAVGTFKGTQLAPINVARGYYKGPQVGVVNVALGPLPKGEAGEPDTFQGPQVSVVNVATGKMKGTQIGVVNVSWGELEGMSLGTVNVAQKQTGAAIGLVNAAGVHEGFTLGLVNVAGKQKGFSLGLVNIAGDVEGESLGLLFNWSNNGIHTLHAFTSEVTPFNVGIKTGTKHLYTQLEFGYGGGKSGNDEVVPGRESRRYSFGAGFGWRQLFGDKVFADLGLMDHQVTHKPFMAEGQGGSTTLASLRLTVGYRIFSHLAVVGGLTYNVAVGWSGADLDLGPSWLQSVKRSGDTTVRMYPGFVAGLEI